LTKAKQPDLNDRQKTRVILEMLKLRHAPPEWAHFAEMQQATGGPSGAMDFFAMNVWKSKKYRRIVYEIKVSRGDFARELANPKKREFAETLAHECFFATTPGLVQIDEIPEGWGLVELTKGGMRRKKHAKQRDPGDLHISFIAALARRGQDKPGDLPLPYWKYAGRELTLDQVMELAAGELEIWKGHVANDAVKRFRESGDYKDLKALQGAVYRTLGWDYSHNPDKLEEYLNGKARLALKGQQLVQLQQARDYLTSAMKVLDPKEE
jgi:hypothetical protein